VRLFRDCVVFRWLSARFVVSCLVLLTHLEFEFRSLIASGRGHLFVVLRLSQFGGLCGFVFLCHNSSSLPFRFLLITSHACRSKFVVSWRVEQSLVVFSFHFVSIVVISLLSIFFVHSEILGKVGVLPRCSQREWVGLKNIF
jgi:hypothetical protein